MRKALYFIMAFFISIGTADAAVRGANSITRNTSKTNTARQSSDSVTVSRTTSRTSVLPRATSTRATITRTAQQPATNARTATTPTTSARGTAQATRATARQTRSVSTHPARATTTTATLTGAYGTTYNTCRDAYFTCMDQFCTTANDKYRRCICSSKIEEIKSREHALTQSSSQLQDFHDLNIYVIDKTAAEVKAITSATAGESAQENARDTSDSAKKLAGISAVLANTKKQALSTQGTLDIAGDISAIWNSTDLIGGTNISNLTGEALYNAVHAQCSEMVASQCGSESTRNMVVSAYGMYIENDCSALINNLDTQLTTANSNIRATEREMNLARLENYDAHNSTSIHDCIAQVRSDITANTACGTDYVHCLDITGLYLTYDTGEPIYSENFFQLEGQISLSGDILTNKTNRLLVAKLNSMREYAERGLDTCRDISDAVWDEFMRQAISEIYQGQHDRIRQVKNECLDVVNKCYDTQNQQLRDFSNIDEKLTLGSRMELSEEMCQEKLNTCSNLYGGGSQGLSLLLNTMHDITDQMIGKQCLASLREYIANTCAVPGNDTLHAAPYACRIYAPGEQRYATNPTCNNQTSLNINTNNPFQTTTEQTTGYICPTLKTYTSCKAGYALARNGVYNYDTSTPGNTCLRCNELFTCDGGTARPKPIEQDEIEAQCGTNYIGSMYHKLARYAMDTCVRPSESDKSKEIPDTILQDINIVMDEMHQQMSTELSKECERLGGIWVNLVWQDNTDGSANENAPDGKHDTSGLIQFAEFYKETAANTSWGYCTPKNTENDNDDNIETVTYTISFNWDKTFPDNGTKLDCNIEGQTNTLTSIQADSDLGTITPPEQLANTMCTSINTPGAPVTHIGWRNEANTISYKYGSKQWTTPDNYNISEDITLYPMITFPVQ